jgi:flagellar biogenesis protein FliO
VTLNFAAAILGVVFNPTDFPSFLLAVFLINLLAYFAYYVIMKFIHGEVNSPAFRHFQLLSFLST